MSSWVRTLQEMDSVHTSSPPATAKFRGKKAKLELLAKHGLSQNNAPREIQQYRCIEVSAVDPLQ